MTSVLILSKRELNGGETIRFRPQGEFKYVEGRYCGSTSGSYLQVQVGEKMHLVLPIDAELVVG